MVSEITGWWEALGAKSQTLYLIATVILLVHAVVHGLDAFTGMEYPLVHGAHVGPLGYSIGFIGLLSLYPAVADTSPKLAAVGAVFAVSGLLGWIGEAVVSLAEVAGISTPGWLEAYGILILLGFVIGYFAVGVASLRSPTIPQTVGLVLLTPLLVMAFDIGVVVADFASATGQFAVATGFALAHLAIAIALRSDEASPDYAMTAGEATP